SDVGIDGALPKIERSRVFCVNRGRLVHLVDVVDEDMAAQPEPLRGGGWGGERGYPGAALTGQGIERNRLDAVHPWGKLGLAVKEDSASFGRLHVLDLAGQ